ncbi:unnamed protein product [Psylliodes chrysocephalus]|uniref:Uncharacterized protein n=1 Tax=Psylliodes chrysocephalus TaxID=3402493 RepID=A0A9P0DBK7_9CUCU|nr:unnamed protein product [Psylliodes chrysocephala]
MNADVFEEYFQQMIEHLQKGSFIVMDNASYYSHLIGRVPNTSWKKDDIIKWLTDRNINFPEKSIKIELLEIVKLNKPPVHYVVVELAKTHGIDGTDMGTS